MKRYILPGTTDYTVLVFIPDPTSTTGAGKTGLVAADLTVSYTRVETDNDVVVTDVTSSLNDLSALTDPHNDWGLLQVSATLAPGLYRLDIADAVLASGAWTAVVQVQITSGLAAVSPMEFVLDNIASDLRAIIGVAQSATDAKDFFDDGYDPSTNKVQGVVLVDTLTTYTGNTVQTGDSFARIGVAGVGLTNINLPDQTFDLTGNITGNLSGSVGSVSGNVGGNVTGSIGSLAAAAKAEVNAEVNDVINVDAKAELAGVPAANASLGDKITFMQMKIRNEETNDGSDVTISNDAGAVIATAPVSDAAGTFTKGEYV